MTAASKYLMPDIELTGKFENTANINSKIIIFVNQNIKIAPTLRK
jgi:hypothetical protein